MVGLSLKIVINLKYAGHRTGRHRTQDTGHKIHDTDHETSLCLCGYFKIPNIGDQWRSRIAASCEGKAGKNAKMSGISSN